MTKRAFLDTTKLPTSASICADDEGSGMEEAVIVVKMPALPGKGPNIVASVLIAPGDVVAKGQELFNVETSKRAVPIVAPASGTIARVLVAQGDEPNAQDVLAEIEEDESDGTGTEPADHEGESDSVGAKSGGKAGGPTEAASGPVGAAAEPIEGTSVSAVATARPAEAASGPAGAAAEPTEGTYEPTRAAAETENESPGGTKPAPERFNMNDRASQLSTDNSGHAPDRFEVRDCMSQRGDAGSANDVGHAELLIIGAGPGGYVAALYAAKHGLRVTLVERDTLGGTCLNRGCIPTKALIASASLHRDIMRAAEWGLQVEGKVRPDMRRIIGRKDRVVSELVNGIEYLMDANGIRVIRGTARFDGNDAVIVSFGGNDGANIPPNGDGNVDVAPNGDGSASVAPHGDGGASASSGGDGNTSTSANNSLRLSFDNCIIATGSTIRELDLPGSDLHEVMNTDEALACTTLPSSVVIVGGGVTGMEFAFMYANLGVEVTVIARRPRILHMFDEDASSTIARSAANHGIRIEFESDVKRFERTSDGLVRTVYVSGCELRETTSERVLVAGGRVPATRDLGLENAGVTLDACTGAVAVDERMRTNVEHVYAIGDVNGLVMLAHAASYQGRIAVDDILGREAAFDRAIVPSVAYTDPEVATVGVGADEARASGTRADGAHAAEARASGTRVDGARAGEVHADRAHVGETRASGVHACGARAGETRTSGEHAAEAHAGEPHASKAPLAVGSFSFAHNGKALADGDAVGYVALICDADDLVKGATIVGGHAATLINSISMAISAGLTGEDVRRAVFAHPTTAEAIHEAACDLSFGALHE